MLPGRLQPGLAVRRPRRCHHGHRLVPARPRDGARLRGCPLQPRRRARQGGPARRGRPALAALSRARPWVALGADRPFAPRGADPAARRRRRRETGDGRVKVLLVGGGGREHALAWKLAQSPRLTRLYAAPGNPGIARHAECVPIADRALDELVALATRERVDLVVVGPELPLSLGLRDRLSEAGLSVFGPTQAAARIESSKAFAKDLMARYGIPTARFRSF